MPSKINLEQFWKNEDFKPNPKQKEAIEFGEGPLLISAGPGSGKTRVLLWRVVNLIVFHSVKPEEIFLATFTEKAANQLKQGLQYLLGQASNLTGQPYDLSKMYMGTLHSNCQKLLTDRRFSNAGERRRSPIILDDMDQYFFLHSNRNWNELLEETELDNKSINEYLQSDNRLKKSKAKHNAVTATISFFNRLSEEYLNPDKLLKKKLDSPLSNLVQMYKFYLEKLKGEGKYGSVDFALLQQKALEVLQEIPNSEKVFKHVIIDEYQDTNPIQEKIYFQLAAGNKNICVVGDDDQALYRFRGATVENFVEFEDRCKATIGKKPYRIDLNINYRSRKQIVDFYTEFMTKIDWKVEGTRNKYHRFVDKDIKAHSKDKGIAVLASNPSDPESVFEEIAALVKNLITKKKVQDPSQIAFLFPTLTGEQPIRMKSALENVGLQVYAPRAGTFLDVEEAKVIIGIFAQIFGIPDTLLENPAMKGYVNWLTESCLEYSKTITKKDSALKQFIEDKKLEIKTNLEDRKILVGIAKKNGWDLKNEFEEHRMKDALANAKGISKNAQKGILNKNFLNVVKGRKSQGTPMSLSYAINQATSLDWSILDLFYQINGFEYFLEIHKKAETGLDEGPICNLSLMSQYISRYIDTNGTIISSEFLEDDKFSKKFFASYLYALYQRGDSEYEDSEDPFPKGRISFLTVHQSKGLEFPVVVLPSPRKLPRLQRSEEILDKLIVRKGEPLERMKDFDMMRMFYVALSRAKNLLILGHLKSSGNFINPQFKDFLEDDDSSFPRIEDFDLKSFPAYVDDPDVIPKNYSYTSDYLQYQVCGRQYMLFRKYGFVPSRSQTMFFGSLVHQTIEDLHNLLIHAKGE